MLRQIPRTARKEVSNEKWNDDIDKGHHHCPGHIIGEYDLYRIIQFYYSPK